MTDYRLYVLDEAGDIVRGQVLAAQNDAAAYTMAASIKNASHWELWSGTRIVAQSHIDQHLPSLLERKFAS